MAEWIVCIACGLKHSARPDGACPRCRTRLAPQMGAATPPPVPSAFADEPLRPAPLQPPYPAPPLEAVQPPRGGWTPEGSARFGLPELTPLEGIPLGSRIAGWILLANVLAAVASALVARAAGGQPSNLGTLTISGAIDLIVGALLVTGHEKVKGWAIARVILGGAIFTPILWSAAGPALGVPQLALSSGLLLLLAGRPRAIRIGLGVTSAGAALVFALAAAASPLATSSVRALLADAAGGHVEELRTTDPVWRLALPPGHWHEVGTKAEGVRQAAWPEVDAAVWVKAQALPRGAKPDVNVMTDGAIDGIRRKNMKFLAHDRREFSTSTGRAVAVRATMSDDKGREVEGWLVIQTSADAFAVMTVVVTGDKPEAMDELQQIATSLELGQSAKSADSP